MAGITGKWTAMLDAVETSIKTITELANDGSRARTQIGRIQAAYKAGDYEALIQPVEVTTPYGTTTRSTWDIFVIWVDVVYCSNQTDNFKQGFQNVLAVAEKVYDKIHLTNISGTCRLARCSIEVGEGFAASQNIDAIPVRVIINAEVPITQ